MINITPFPLGQGYPLKIYKIRSYVGYDLKLSIFITQTTVLYRDVRP